jgi:hypothetical protein
MLKLNLVATNLTTMPVFEMSRCMAQLTTFRHMFHCSQKGNCLVLMTKVPHSTASPLEYDIGELLLNKYLTNFGSTPEEDIQKYPYSPPH